MLDKNIWVTEGRRHKEQEKYQFHQNICIECKRKWKKTRHLENHHHTCGESVLVIVTYQCIRKGTELPFNLYTELPNLEAV